MTDQELILQRLDSICLFLSTISRIHSEEWEFKKEFYGIDKAKKEKDRLSHERNLETLRKFKAEEAERKGNQSN